MSMKPIERAGNLRQRLHFQSREMEPDPWGGEPREGEFATRFTVSASLVPFRSGSEAVIASRLQGIQPYIVKVRQSTTTRAVDETWRLVDARDDKRVFAIKAPPTDPDQKRAWLEFLVEQGRPE